MNAQQLKNAILQMAVQGKLVPQDPNDEPASVLLERIRKEKEKLIKEGKIKKEKNPSYIFRGEDNLPYEKVGKNEPVCIADEVPFEIPDSWEWARLCDLTTELTLNDGNWVLSDDMAINGEVKLIQLGNIGNGEYAEKGYKYVTEKHFYELGGRRIYGGYLLVNRLIGDKMLCCIIPPKDDFLMTAVDVCWIAPQNDIYNLEYIMYVLLSGYFQEKVKLLGRGTTRFRISKGNLINVVFPFPPLEEQNRIVSEIKKFLPLISEYNTKEAKVRELNASFPELLKKSILQQAVMGKLVPQDSNDEPVSVLLEKIRAEKNSLFKAGKLKKDKHKSIIYRMDNSYYERLDGVERCIDDEIPFDIPDNWCWFRLQEICSLIADVDHNMPKSVSETEGKLFLSAKDLLDDDTINYTNNVKYISKYDFDRLSKKAKPQRNDIIYSRIGAALGKARVVERDIEFIVSYSCCVIRALRMDVKYLRYYLESPFILRHSVLARQSIGVPDLGMGEIKHYLVAIPPLEEQKRIVAKIEELIPYCNLLTK